MFEFLVFVGVLEGMTKAGAIASCAATVVCGFLWTVHAVEHSKPNEQQLSSIELIKKRFFRFLWIALVMITLSGGMPSRRDLAESYALSEASKLATAENVTKVADEVLRRVDTLLGKFGNSESTTIDVATDSSTK